MTRRIKSIIAIAAACAAAIACTFISACTSRNGRDGKDMDFYDVFEAVNAEREAAGEEPYTVSQFVKEYFGYISEEAEQAITEKAVMNRSLLSAVTVITETKSGSMFNAKYTMAAGAGVIVDMDDDGNAYIVTNAHVVYNSDLKQYSSTIYAYLYGSDVSGTDYLVTGSGIQNINGIPSSDISIAGVSLTYDLAVLKVSGSEVLERSNAVKAKFAQDEVFAVGERVYAVGNPLWEGLSVSTGIISRDSEVISLDLSDADYRVMRTDAAINSGNSGGGLFNMDGEMVAIVNSGATTDSEGNDVDNMSYALPSSYARRIVQSMIDRYEQTGKVSYSVSKAQLGVSCTVADSYAEYDGESGETLIKQSMEVYSVSGAASGVLRQGDILKRFSVGVAQSPIKDGAYEQRKSEFTVPEDVSYSVAQHYFTVPVTRDYIVSDAMFSVRTGDTVELEIERGGKTYYAYITYSDNSYFKTFG